MDDDINSILEYEVFDPEYLQICNGLRSPSDAINFKLLLEYMCQQNEDYCAKEGLCEICHSPLKLVQDRGEVWGARNVVIGEYYICPNGCT